MIEYRMEGNGTCHTPCPHDKGCMVNSHKCSQCPHYFGDSGGVVKCNFKGGKK
jgi:hypothetical protein